MNELFTKYFSGEMTQDEKRVFLKQVLADEELQKEFTRLKNLYALTSISSGNPDSTQYVEKKWKELQNKKTRKKQTLIFTSFYRYAAVIIIVIASTWMVFDWYTIQKGNTILTEIEVPVGQKVHLLLSDGTAVWLNSQTKIKYPQSFGSGVRDIYLDGEAYFEVARNEKKPFVVHTSRGNIKVLGTTFNVFNYSNNSLFETTLLEGSVMVEREVSNEKVILKPNEQVILTEGKLVKTKIEAEHVMAWRDGIIDFDNQELGNIIKRLESYYGLDFIIQEPARLKEKFSAKFLLGDKIEEILIALERTGRVSFITSMDGKIVHVK